MEEKEWLGNLRSNENNNVWRALESVTPDLAKKYRYEIISKAMNTPLGVKYLPTEILEQWPDFCVELARKDPKYIGYIPETVMKEHQEIIDGITSNQWDTLIKEGRYRHMPLEVFEGKKEQIFENFEMRKDSAGRLTNEICEKHPDAFVRAIKTMKSDKDIGTNYIRATFPAEFLDKYKDEMARLDKVSEERARYLKMIKEAESLLHDVNAEICNVERSTRKNMRKQEAPGGSEDGSR